MKTILMMLSLGPCLSLLCQAQPVRLTGLDRAGNLTWTNLLCVTEPVYELLQTHSLALAQSRLPYSRDGTSLRVFLTGFGGEGTLYLDGTLERSQASGGCPYHRYSGIVWYVGFETQGIGTFVATPVP
jgi:hypothetical protein